MTVTMTLNGSDVRARQRALKSSASMPPEPGRVVDHQCHHLATDLTIRGTLALSKSHIPCGVNNANVSRTDF